MRDEALAISALQELLTDLFPPLFKVALTGRHAKKPGMQRALALLCLPVEALMKIWRPRRLGLGEYDPGREEERLCQCKEETTGLREKSGVKRDLMPDGITLVNCRGVGSC